MLQCNIPHEGPGRTLKGGLFFLPWLHINYKCNTNTHTFKLELWNRKSSPAKGWSTNLLDATVKRTVVHLMRQIIALNMFQKAQTPSRGPIQWLQSAKVRLSRQSTAKASCVKVSMALIPASRWAHYPTVPFLWSRKPTPLILQGCKHDYCCWNLGTD